MSDQPVIDPFAPPAPDAAPAVPTPPPPPAPLPSTAAFLPPQSAPDQVAQAQNAPPRPVGEPIAVGTIVARIPDDDPYGDGPRAGCVLASIVDEASGTHQAIVGWFESNSHPVDTATLTVL
jgi:hypothetical protein